MKSYLIETVCEDTSSKRKCSSELHDTLAESRTPVSNANYVVCQLADKRIKYELGLQFYYRLDARSTIEEICKRGLSTLYWTEFFARREENVSPKAKQVIDSVNMQMDSVRGQVYS